MAIAANHFMSTMLMLALLIITLSLLRSELITEGTVQDCLVHHVRVVQLFKQYNIQRMRIFDTDPETLDALRGSNIELTVGIQNRDLQPLVDNPTNANNWVRDNIIKYQNVKFRHVIVGNEVRPGNPNTQQYVPFVLRAMRNINNAISPLRCGIKVTTAVDTEIIDPSSNFPPAKGRFRPEVSPYLDPIVRFLVDTDAPLFANIYPYFAYISAPNVIDRQYALLNPNYTGVDTPGGKYQNLFYSLLDTVNAALEKSVGSMSFADADKKAPPEVKGGESGWSSGRRPPIKGVESGQILSPIIRGDIDRRRPPFKRRDRPPPGSANIDDIANIENAREYVNNLIQAVKKGTPRRPGQPIETYIFTMFDENQKPGNEEERHFGLSIYSRRST
ncbi:hypothetical protein CASFOL_030865 [Castilleja foliolosa]|uniref:Glucan endo-1,3-beta-D-glucosidase n=1 Tax=Castilleja foliolosa TaxID=1961234 RepID=A0ABD3C7U8_9LAMI